jgi:capsular polysaccharide biosynthesis protein
MSAITGSHDDLVRKVKDAASRYELLATKWEQARIDDNLDRQRIANMVVAEAPTRKSVPQPKGDTNMIAGIVLALILVVGIAWIQGMRRKQVYTPWELEGIVGAPVLGAVPLQGPAHRRQLPAAPAPA